MYTSEERVKSITIIPTPVAACFTSRTLDALVLPPHPALPPTHHRRRQRHQNKPPPGATKKWQLRLGSQPKQTSAAPALDLLCGPRPKSSRNNQRPLALDLLCGPRPKSARNNQRPLALALWPSAQASHRRLTSQRGNRWRASAILIIRAAHTKRRFANSYMDRGKRERSPSVVRHVSRPSKKERVELKPRLQRLQRLLYSLGIDYKLSYRDLKRGDDDYLLVFAERRSHHKIINPSKKFCAPDYPETSKPPQDLTPRANGFLHLPEPQFQSTSSRDPRIASRLSRKDSCSRGQSPTVKSIIVVPEKNNSNCELKRCETITSGALQALQGSVSSEKTHFDKITHDDKGLVALDIAIDILAGPSKSHQLTNNSFSSSPAKSETHPQSSVLPSRDSQLDSVLGSQRVNQISISPSRSPDLAPCEPRKKINLDEYNARRKTATKKKWTREDSIREYANRPSLKEARELQIPKKTSFSPIYRPRPAPRKEKANPLLDVVSHNNELIPEKLDFEPADAFPQILQEFELAWELGLVTPPTAPCNSSRILSSPSQARSLTIAESSRVEVATLTENETPSHLAQHDLTKPTPCARYTIDNDPEYNHFPLFKKIQEEFDYLARPFSPPLTPEKRERSLSPAHLSNPPPASSSDSSSNSSDSSTSSSSSDSSSNSSDSSTSSSSSDSSSNSSDSSTSSSSSDSSSNSSESSTSSPNSSVEADKSFVLQIKKSSEFENPLDWSKWDRCFPDQ
ncbi:hypothetical protein QAD02_019100 [Eretmocerus hayati]|uniref:Uncharacterized protein n=1 Tax=Eretmocerus hayati TaxID=131215 RepID=A0ACC2PJT6_9HYME|nr:hypothetical protein QAD02_019100 [Eretmocerus hayati]